MSLTIIIQTVPHKAQRYETVGDWRSDGGANMITVSRMPDRDYEFLIAVHELVEMYLCQKRRVAEEAVTAFDVAFEAARVPGNTDEPGDDPAAPYRREHKFATKIEALIAAELGVDWAEYERAVNAL